MKRKGMAQIQDPSSQMKTLSPSLELEVQLVSCLISKFHGAGLLNMAAFILFYLVANLKYDNQKSV